MRSVHPFNQKRLHLIGTASIAVESWTLTRKQRVNNNNESQIAGESENKGNVRKLRKNHTAVPPISKIWQSERIYLIIDCM